MRRERPRPQRSLRAKEQEDASARAQEQLPAWLAGQLAETQDIHVETLRLGEVLDVKNGLEHAAEDGRRHGG